MYIIIYTKGNIQFNDFGERISDTYLLLQYQTDEGTLFISLFKKN